MSIARFSFRRIFYYQVARVLLVFVLLGVIGYQVWGHFQSFDGQFDVATQHLRWPLVLIVIVLCPVNWFLETIKWRALLPFDLSIVQAYRSVLAGNTIGLATPANLGDYAGRLSSLHTAQYADGLTATLVSSLSQNVINVLIGLLGSLFLLRRYNLDGSQTIMLVTLAGLVMLLVLLLCSTSLRRWSSRQLSSLANTYKPLQKLYESTQYLSISSSLAALWLSTLRYLVYASQYVLMLSAVGLDIELWLAYGGVATVYLVQSGLPLPPVMALLARGETAILVWSQVLGADLVLVLLASFGVWLINRAITAVIGAIWLLLPNQSGATPS